ncbi:MAG: hypothetical protein V1835_03230 [Candidatus Micrarchaeota archaeon]
MAERSGREIEQFLYRMYASTTPDRFITKVLFPASREGRITRDRFHSEAKFPAFQQLLRDNKGQGKYRRLVFVRDDGAYERKCGMAIESLQFTDARYLKEGRQPLPKARLFKNLHIRFGHLDFGQLKGMGLTTKPQTTQSGKGKVSFVMIPEGLVAHWKEWELPNIENGEANTLRILLNPEIFDKLDEEGMKRDFIANYLATVSYLRGDLGKGQREYAELLAIEPEKGNSHYQSFHFLHRHNAPLMKEIYGAIREGKTETQFADIFKKRLGLHRNIAADFASGLFGAFRSSESMRMKTVSAIRLIAMHAGSSKSGIPADPSSS